MNQRYTIPDKIIGLLNDIAMEEFSHLRNDCYDGL